MTYEDFKDLARRTNSDKVFRDKDLHLASMSDKFFHKENLR